MFFSHPDLIQAGFCTLDNGKSTAVQTRCTFPVSERFSMHDNPFFLNMATVSLEHTKLNYVRLQYFYGSGTTFYCPEVNMFVSAAINS